MIFRKLASIVTGWYFLATNRNNKIAKDRLSVCAVCEFRKGLFCSICGCHLQAKARLTGTYDDGCADDPKRWEAIKKPGSDQRPGF